MTIALTVAIIVIAYLLRRLGKLEDSLAEQKSRYQMLKDALTDTTKLKDALEEKSYNIEHGLMNIVRENNQLMKYVNEFRTIDIDSYRQHEIKRLKDDLKSLQEKEVFTNNVTEDQETLPIEGGLS